MGDKKEERKAFYFQGVFRDEKQVSDHLLDVVERQTW